jgi:hypothetical protein
MQNVFDRVSRHLDIDSKLKLKIVPRKLSSELISNLDSKFPRANLVYLVDTGKILNLVTKNHGFIGVLHGLKLDGEDDGLQMFVPHEEKWVYEFVFDNGKVHSYVLGCEWVTDLKLKIVS